VVAAVADCCQRGRMVLLPDGTAGAMYGQYKSCKGPSLTLQAASAAAANDDCWSCKLVPVLIYPMSPEL
jgi:hypothetical protein